MNTLFFYSLLVFPIFLPGAEPIPFEIAGFKIDLDDPDSFVESLGEVGHGSDKEKKAEFATWLDSAIDDIVKAGVSPGAIIEAKNKLNEIARPGGIPNKISSVDIINEIKEVRLKC